MARLLAKRHLKNLVSLEREPWSSDYGRRLMFQSFSNKQYKILQQMNVKKCPSSIQRWDSNSQPSDYETPPLTTRPVLPPKKMKYL